MKYRRATYLYVSTAIVIHDYRSSWYTDEHFRECYSFISKTTEKLNVGAKDLAKPILAADGKPVRILEMHLH